MSPITGMSRDDQGPQVDEMRKKKKKKKVYYASSQGGASKGSGRSFPPAPARQA